MFKILTEQEIRKQVPMPVAIALMKEAFILLNSEGVNVPARTVIENTNFSGRALFMPSYAPAFGLFGLKMVSVFDHNAQKGLPVIQGKMLVMDAATGTPVALLDAACLTALRTGAASGLATDLLARREARVLAVFGTGVQAITQVAGVLAVRNIREVMVFGTSPGKVSSFCKKISEMSAVTARSAARSDLKKADIICLATTSATPVLEAEEISQGVHINGIGSYKPAQREIPGGLIIKSRLVVDQREAALAEAGDIIIPLKEGLISENHVAAELGEIADGTREGRTAEDQITIFKSVGNAIQDLAIAKYLLQH